MMTGAVPVQILFESILSREQIWGRLFEFTPAGARLESLFEMRPGEKIFLTFELAGEAFLDLQAEVRHVHRDRDGYWDIFLSFRDRAERRRLSLILLDMAASGP